MQVQTLKAHRYDNRVRKPGELYFIKPQDLRLARALGWVGDAAPSAPKVEPVPPKAEARPAYLPAVVEGERAKRRYQRRDLLAEE